MQYTDEVFAAIDHDQGLERIAGGNETEVYSTDDGRYVVKLKHELAGTRESALAHAKTMRAAAEQFAACLGPRYTIPSYYLISRDNAGQVQVLVLQPYLHGGQALADLDYHALSATERARVAEDLREIIRRSLLCYRATGSMPDLYGRKSASTNERQQAKAWARLPQRLWSFIVQRNLLRAHNLVLSGTPNAHVVLVDYDIVRRNRLYRFVYFAVRWMLFWRDHALITLMRRSDIVPR